MAEEKNKVQGIFDSIEAFATLAAIVSILVIGFFFGGIASIDLSVNNTNLHIFLLLFAFLAPRVGGLICGGIESCLWGIEISYRLYDKQVIGLIIPSFFIGSIGCILLFFFLRGHIIRLINKMLNK